MKVNKSKSTGRFELRMCMRRIRASRRTISQHHSDCACEGIVYVWGTPTASIAASGEEGGGDPSRVLRPAPSLPTHVYVISIIY